ncbi:MAG: cytochrome c [Candidatus Baltobacteraceae bacterium]
MQLSAGSLLAASLANGQALFQTGRDAQGKHIAAERPPLRPSCVACHGVSGAGGLRLPGNVVSADLRNSALVAGQHHPYTPALVERAISTGIDNNGQLLNPVMPRWKLSRQDLRDVANYILTRLK